MCIPGIGKHRRAKVEAAVSSVGVRMLKVWAALPLVERKSLTYQPRAIAWRSSQAVKRTVDPTNVMGCQNLLPPDSA